MIKFSRILTICRSNFDHKIRIWDIKFVKSKFECMRTNSPELTIHLLLFVQKCSNLRLLLPLTIVSFHITSYLKDLCSKNALEEKWNILVSLFSIWKCKPWKKLCKSIFSRIIKAQSFLLLPAVAIVALAWGQM